MQDNNKVVCIIGLGYVGCVSAGCLAKAGHRVIGVDNQSSKVARVNSGKATVIEPGLDDLICEGVAGSSIEATVDMKSAILKSNVVLICVGTPNTEDGDLDLSRIYSVVREIGNIIEESDKFHAIAIRSTVKPGTCEKLVRIITEASTKMKQSNFSVVSNPEFLREGTAIQDYLNPPYVLVGANDVVGAELVATLYQDVNAETLNVSVSTAELIKYVNNSWHALKVAFGNEIGSICKALNIDSTELIDVFLRDKILNVSESYLRPGNAFGGSCLTKDLSGLVKLAEGADTEIPLLASVHHSNEAHIQRAVRLILQHEKKKVSILGISFKAGTDDVRGSPTIKIIRELLKHDYEIRVFDETVSEALSKGLNQPVLEDQLKGITEFLVNSEKELLAHGEIFILAKNDPAYCKLLKDIQGRPVVDLVNASASLKKTDNYVGVAWS